MDASSPRATACAGAPRATRRAPSTGLASDAPAVRHSAAVSIAAGAGVLGTLALTALLTRLALTVADTLAGEGLAGLPTTVSTACCALVAGRLALALTATAVVTALPGSGRGRRGGARIALALTPRALRPVVALLLTAGVAVGGAGTAAATVPPTAVSGS